MRVDDAWTARIRNWLADTPGPYPTGVQQDIRHLLGVIDGLRVLLAPDPNEEKRLAILRRKIDAGDDRVWCDDCVDTVRYLLDRLDGMQAITADALNESEARRMGAAEERARLLGILERLFGSMGGGQAVGLDAPCSAIRRAPPLPDLPPPAAARAEADRLRAALREIADTRFFDRTVASGLDYLRDLARTALREEDEP